MQRPLLFRRLREGADEMTQRFFGMRGEEARGKTSECGISLLDFARLVGQCGFVTGDCGEIATRDGAGPRFRGAEALEIRERLTNQRQKSHRRAAAREADVHQNAQRAFDDDEQKRGGEGAGCVISGFDVSTQSDRNSADGARDAARDALRVRVALDGKDNAIERRRGALTKSLKRMERASESASASERRENGRIEGAAGVKNDFAATFVSAETREFCGDFMNGVIGSGDENDVSLENAGGNAGKGITGSDGADGGTRGGLRTCDDSADFPVDAMQTASQDASEASGSYNRNGGGHCA